MRKASAALEAFIDETIRRGSAKGYHPTIFISMRSKFGTLQAISKLVRSGELQSGFERLHQLNLLEWTIESAVENFPEEFSPDDRECASFRLRLAREQDTYKIK